MMRMVVVDLIFIAIDLLSVGYLVMAEPVQDIKDVALEAAMSLKINYADSKELN